MEHRSDLFRRASILSAAIALATIGAPAVAKQELDAYSYKLGGLASWSEAVGAGVKELALSAPADPAEMDELAAAAGEIAAEHGVRVYRETDFLVTDLFPAAVTDGKHVLLIYKGDTLDRYLALKRKKAASSTPMHTGETPGRVSRGNSAAC